jgi:hypothetical protein
MHACLCVCVFLMTFCTVVLQYMQGTEFYVCVFIIYLFILRQVIPIVLSVQSKCTTFQSEHVVHLLQKTAVSIT